VKCTIYKLILTEVALCWSHWWYGNWKWACMYCRYMWKPVEW